MGNSLVGYDGSHKQVTQLCADTFKVSDNFINVVYDNKKITSVDFIGGPKLELKINYGFGKINEFVLPNIIKINL